MDHRSTGPCPEIDSDRRASLGPDRAGPAAARSPVPESVPVGKEDYPGSGFAAALREALRAAGSDPPAGAALAAAMRRVREALPEADNMGGTRDGRDLYTLIDDLAQGARDAYPESLCKSGCSGCCHYPAGLFTATRQEWDAIYDHIAATWPSEHLRIVVRRFWQTHGPYLQRLRAVEWLMEFPLPVNARREAVPLACPFLDDDRCSIYQARPTYCRCFGQFTFKYWWKRVPILYACEGQTDHMEPITRMIGRARLPSFNPIFNRRFALSRRGRRHLLALWFARRWPRKWLERES